MNPGDFKHRIIVQANTPSKDPNGGDVDSWATSTTNWAAIQTLTGKKLEIARQIDAEATVQIRMRYCGTNGVPGISVLNRILWGTRVLEPILVVNEHEQNRFVQVLCKEKRGAYDE